MRCDRPWCCAVLLAGVAAAAAPVCAAELPPDPRAIFSFTLDNDLFGGSDRYYASGFQFSWRSPSYDPPVWLGRIVEAATFFFPQGGSRRWGLGFTQNIFTPDDTERRNPDPLDRPYAGWLYGAVSLTSYTPTSYDTFELRLGVVGPAALGEQVQNNLHDVLNIDRALGWDHQLKDEFGINAIATRQWRMSWPLGPGRAAGARVRAGAESPPASATSRPTPAPA